MSNQEFAGKVALVTGAGKNIGRSIALSFAAAGAAVGVNTRESRAEAESVVREIQAAGGKAALFMADVADAAAVNTMVEGVVKQFGRLDMLVLNASYRKETLFMDMSFEEWRRVMSISLDGSFHCIKASLPHLIKAGGGNIVVSIARARLSFLQDSVPRDPIADPALQRLQRARNQCAGSEGGGWVGRGRVRPLTGRET